MSAPQIPNLNTLRRGGDSGLRGRFRGRGGGTGNEDGHHRQAGNTAAKDKIVQGTDNDASVSRFSAVELGYLNDPFARTLTTGEAGPGTRRFPIINRGTYVRTIAIDNLVNRFLDDDNGQQPRRKKQIISLGAGSDTRAFRISAKNPDLPVVYHELDFSVNTAAKIKAIRSTPLLQQKIRIDKAGSEREGIEEVTVSTTGDALHSTNYHIHPIDLRSLASHTTIPDSQAVSETGSTTGEHSYTSLITLLPDVDPSLPTLLISECCLIYLSPTEADGVVDYFTKTLFPPTTPLGLIIYEPIRPNDPFGKTMVSNLAARGIQLQTLHKYASLEAQRQRLRDQHFEAGQGAADINFIWDHWVSEAEKERVARLEMLDEVEEWRLLAQHYCVAWGWKENRSLTPENSAFQGWKNVRPQSIAG